MKLVYQGFDQSGAAVPGTIDANDVAEARETLRSRGLYVLSIKELEAASELSADEKAPRFGRMRQLRNVAMFTRQMHVLISTGTPLVEALAALERQAKEPGWRRIVAGVRVKVEDGASLSAAMAGYPKHFDAVCRSLVAAGESAGNLDVMLDRLGVLAQKQVHIRSAAIGAMVYPSLLIVVAISVLLTMLVFVLPRFAMLFKSLDTPLPPTTQMLVSLSDLTRNYWWLIVPLAGAAAFGVWTWLRTSQGQRMTATASLKTPRIGLIVRNFATARITRLMGILLQGRVPLVESLRLTRESLTIHQYVELLSRADEAVTRGESLASAFADTDLVAPSVYEAMRSGDKSGQLGPLLITVADFLDEENEVTLRSLTSILEPLILMVLGLLVGFVALSMFMPLFDLTAATHG
jgi:type II secretory pathway component PulF